LTKPKPNPQPKLSYYYLPEDPDVKRWYDNVARGWSSPPVSLCGAADYDSHPLATRLIRIPTRLFYPPESHVLYPGSIGELDPH